MKNRGFKLEVQQVLVANTAKRLSLKARGCFNPGLSSDSNIEPRRGATALRLVPFVSANPRLSEHNPGL
jgi:hypothetical protein